MHSLFARLRGPISIAVALLASAAAPAQAARLFAPDSVWNAHVPRSAPVPASSQRLVADLHRQVVTAGTWINTTQYSTPVYTVPSDQAPVRVSLDVTYPTLQADFAAVPLPPHAQPARGSDGQLTIYQPSTDTLWEFWQLREAADGWHARWGGKMTSVSDDPGYFPAPFGATGTSLPLVGGLIRINELRRGRIDHSLALAIPASKEGVFVSPAQRTDGNSDRADAIPQGTRLRLDPSLDIASLHLPRVARAIARAAQRYGVIVRDYAPVVTFYAEDPTPTGSNPYPVLFGGRSPSELLARFPWSRLQVVDAR